ncbi:MAG TPA: glycosyltransferase family 39 protein [Candidatus Sulfotelmatobacter sp.]|nr:glycosyltransferase family 39 protein [Candidatus Sulfotelmatobacter sp.]
MDANSCAPLLPTAKESKLFFFLLLFLFLVAGTSAIGLSFVPFKLLAAKVRGMSGSGQGAFFDANFYRAMQIRLRVIGMANLLASGVVFALQKSIRQFIEHVKGDSIQLAAALRSSVSRIPPEDLIALGAVTLVGAGLRLSFLFQPMRDDEAYTFLQYSSRPFYVGLSFYNAPNNHIFHTLLVRLSYLFFGNHPWDLRLPALVAGICLVPATYAAGRSLYCNQGALLAAALVSASSILVEFSTNARGYIQICAVFMILVPIAAHGMRESNRAAWLLFAILSALGFYTIPIMLYPFGGIVLWLTVSAAFDEVRPRGRSLMLNAIVAVGITLLLAVELYSPVFAVSGPAAVLANKWVASKTFHLLIQGLPPSLASVWHQWNRDLPRLLSILLVAGLAIGLIFHRRCGKHRVPLVVIVALWIASSLLVQRVVPFERVWLFALPLYLIVASAGLALVLEPFFRRVRLAYAIPFVAITLSLFFGFRVQQRRSIYLTNEGRGLEDLAIFLKLQLQQGDSVTVVLPSDSPLAYYFQLHGVSSAYMNAPIRARELVVVNEVAGDTVESVLRLAKLPQATPAKLIAKFDSAYLYEVRR